MNLSLPPLPLPRIAPPRVPADALPTTDELLNQMRVVMFFPGTGWQARRMNCKDYGPVAPTARQAMMDALK